MATETDFDALERALSRTADRHVPPPIDPRQLRRRRACLEVGPVVWLLVIAAFVVAAAIDRSWWFACGIGLLLIPGALTNLIARRREVAALTDPGDLAEYEKRYFEAQAKHQRSAVLIEVTAAVAFAIVAWQAGEAWRWIVPAVFGTLALGRAITVLPYVERANRDAGGERPYGWSVQVLLLVLFLLLPLLLVAGGVRGVWRRIRTGLGGRR